MKIGIVGFGYVGKGIARLFGDNVFAIYDPGISQYNYDPKARADLFAQCDMTVICVPTNEKEGGECDTSIVYETAEWLSKVQDVILLKSTVKPGTTDELNKKYGDKFAMSPEYMGEGGYFTPYWKYPDPKEMKMHSFQIFGGPRAVTKKVVDIFVRKIGPHAFYAQTTAKTAELVKYMENSWGAMKVIFANEWYDICETHGVDYREVRELWALDSRVEKMHTAVFTHKRGYGGKCFPKDVNAIIHATKEAGYDPRLMRMVQQRNKDFNKLNED